MLNSKCDWKLGLGVKVSASDYDTDHKGENTILQWTNRDVPALHKNSELIYKGMGVHMRHNTNTAALDKEFLAKNIWPKTQQYTF